MVSVMVGNATKVAFVLLVTLAVIIPCLEVGIAYKIALDAYVPTPEDVTNELNLHHNYKEEGMTRLIVVSNSDNVVYGFNYNGIFRGYASKDRFMDVRIWD
ncbi:putative isoaspartyl peptidase/L-asparaginase 2, partial [Mucuna pruriens]